MSMDKREIEGSPERSADRGRQEDLGWPEGAKPSLGRPDVVLGIVQAFASSVIGVRADYNADKLTGEQSQQKINALANEYGGVFMGRDARYEPLPWNSPERLGRRIKLVLPEAADSEDDPGYVLFLSLARSVLDLATGHENEHLSDAAARGHLTQAIEGVQNLLMGYPT